jgi:putative FmdB family regulatory protein
MPIYEYRCENCGKVFEKLTKACNRDEEMECPVCGSKETRRIFSVFGVSGSDSGGGESHGPSCGGG